MRIRYLYTEPSLIDPITFYDGINIIFGERSSLSEKRNSVGKSLCIEFINFALLKRKAESRVGLIPPEVFPLSTKVCLDFEIGKDKFTIKRSLEKSEEPEVFENERLIEFTKIEDAVNYLTGKLFAGEENHPNFRAMLGPLIRDEKSEFKSLVNCYDTKLRIAENYAPHLFLLGIDIDIYQAIKTKIKEIKIIGDEIKKIDENVLLLRQKNIKDSRSDLNALDSEVKKIQDSIDKLENLTGYEIVRDDILKLEANLSEKKNQKAVLQSKLNRLRPLEKDYLIDVSEVAEFYNNIKTSMGEFIKRELDEVIYFKSKIDEFQSKLINDRRSVLHEELRKLDADLTELDKRYSQSLSVLDQQGDLKGLKQTYAAFGEKSDQLGQLRGFVSRYDKLLLDRQSAKAFKEQNLSKLQLAIIEQSEVIKNFEETILQIHEFIQGNRHASFQVNHTSTNQVVELNMRIDSDRGHSVEKEKVFIYDMALLINAHTRQKHPGFLIHDNIFDVDNDTLIKSLRFLVNRANLDHQQYILTLNSDSLGAIAPEDWRMVVLYMRTQFTKEKPFLKVKYQEVK